MSLELPNTPTSLDDAIVMGLCFGSMNLDETRKRLNLFVREFLAEKFKHLTFDSNPEVAEKAELVWQQIVK